MPAMRADLGASSALGDLTQLWQEVRSSLNREDLRLSFARGWVRILMRHGAKPQVFLPAHNRLIAYEKSRER